MIEYHVPGGKGSLPLTPAVVNALEGVVRAAARQHRFCGLFGDGRRPTCGVCRALTVLEQ